MSLIYDLCLQQFCSPLFSLFGFTPVFVEFDQVVPGFYSVWVSVTEFESAQVTIAWKPKSMNAQASSAVSLFHIGNSPFIPKAW